MQKREREPVFTSAVELEREHWLLLRASRRRSTRTLRASPARAWSFCPDGRSPSPRSPRTTARTAARAGTRRRASAGGVERPQLRATGGAARGGGGGGGAGRRCRGRASTAAPRVTPDCPRRGEAGHPAAVEASVRKRGDRGVPLPRCAPFQRRNMRPGPDPSLPVSWRSDPCCALFALTHPLAVFAVFAPSIASGLLERTHASSMSSISATSTCTFASLSTMSTRSSRLSDVPHAWPEAAAPRRAPGPRARPARPAPRAPRAWGPAGPGRPRCPGPAAPAPRVPRSPLGRGRPSRPSRPAPPPPPRRPARLLARIARVAPRAIGARRPLGALVPVLARRARPGPAGRPPRRPVSPGRALLAPGPGAPSLPSMPFASNPGTPGGPASPNALLPIGPSPPLAPRAPSSLVARVALVPPRASAPGAVRPRLASSPGARPSRPWGGRAGAPSVAFEARDAAFALGPAGRRVAREASALRARVPGGPMGPRTPGCPRAPRRPRGLVARGALLPAHGAKCFCSWSAPPTDASLSPRERTPGARRPPPAPAGEGRRAELARKGKASDARAAQHDLRVVGVESRMLARTALDVSRTASLVPLTKSPPREAPVGLPLGRQPDERQPVATSAPSHDSSRAFRRRRRRPGRSARPCLARRTGRWRRPRWPRTGP